MKLVFCSAQPAERAGGFLVFGHLSILVPSRKSGGPFDRSMPVL
jgi:hypothetical protein